MPNFRNNMAESNFQPDFPLPKKQSAPFAQVLLEIIEDASLSAGAFRLYTLLVGYSRGFGVCWLSQHTLAEKLGVSERTVRGWLSELEQSGYLSVEHRRTQAGQQQTNLYRLHRYVSVKEEEPAYRKKPATTGGTALPPPSENFSQNRRNTASADSYESNLHEKEYMNTPGETNLRPTFSEQQVCEIGSEISEVSETPEQSVPGANKTIPITPEQLTLTLIEQQLRQAGISANRVKKAAKTLLQNGRTSRYVEDWIHWIARQSHIQNPAAYLLSRIVENTEVPRSRQLQTNRSVYSFTSSPPGAVTVASEPALNQEEPASTADFCIPADTVATAPKLKLVVDNTRQAGTSACSEETQTGLHLIVNNLPPCNAMSEVALLVAPPGSGDYDPLCEPTETEERDISQNNLKSSSAGSGIAAGMPNQGATEPKQKLAPTSTTIDFRLKELMAQRDNRLKRVKRLEVIGDTLYVAFWSNFDRDEGPGASWLADVRYFNPEVTKLELV